jgi:hypothetical protein
LISRQGDLRMMVYLGHVSTFVKEMWEDIKHDGTDNLPTLLYFFLLMLFCIAAVFISTSAVN